MSGAARNFDDRPEKNSEVAVLREEIRKLRKINAALMDRVERSSDMAGSAFSMFETAISLEVMVRERTSALEDALGKLAQANADLGAAHESADAARMRLRDAIDSINEGFILFDAEDRLVLFNEAYLGFWPEMAGRIREGMTFDEMAHMAVEYERPIGSLVAPDRWVSDRLARHGVAEGGHVQALADGRWVQINELRTSEGGIVGIYTDITEVKSEDARNRARELAERNLILQATLDNLSEGVCVFASDGRLSAWNDALQRLLELPEGWSQTIATHQALIFWCRTKLGIDDGGCLEWREYAEGTPRVQQLCPAGDRHIEIRSTAMERGGQVIGFADVTDMLLAQESLRDTAEALERHVSERTSQLIAVNRQLEEEVAERRQIESELLEAKTAAEKANLSKPAFLQRRAMICFSRSTRPGCSSLHLGIAGWRCRRGRWSTKRRRRSIRSKTCSRRCWKSADSMQVRSTPKSPTSESTSYSIRCSWNSGRWRNREDFSFRSLPILCG